MTESLIPATTAERQSRRSVVGRLASAGAAIAAAAAGVGISRDAAQAATSFAGSSVVTTQKEAHVIDAAPTPVTNCPLIQTQYRTIGGLSIRFAESEPREEHALLLSPWPESVYAYEPTWQRLAERTHLVAIDLPGFGQSEYREALMSPRAMGELIVRVADSFGLEQPHLVGPDVGASTSLFAAADAPGRFRSVAIGSGGVSVPLDLGGVLKDWVEAPNVDAYRDIDGREIVKLAMSTLERYQPTDAAREDYLASYIGERFADSMAFVRSYPQQLPVLRDLLPEIETPVLIINGARDSVVPPANAEYLHALLPHSQLALPDAGHFVWEDAADEYAALLAAWWGGGYVEVE